jgi:GTP-binding protein
MPQTRFVLRQALNKGLKAIVVINKVDRPAARVDYAVNATFDLFIDLGANEEQADFPIVYTIGLEGRAGRKPEAMEADLTVLFDTILTHIPPPVANTEAPTQMLVSTLEYSKYVGKIAIGRLQNGTMRSGQTIMHINAEGVMKPAKISQVFSFRNLQREAEEAVYAGNIVAVAGIDNVGIGDTLADPNDPRPLPPIKVEEPTVRMTFSVNDSPFAGRDGQYLTSRQLRARLMAELEHNVSLRVEETDLPSDFLVAGRGELHLAILIETMRREGSEFAVSPPEVIYKESAEGLLEPMEQVYVEALSDYLGAVTEMLGKRRGQLVNIRYGEDGTVYAEFLVPTRGLLGFRQLFLTATRGTGIFNTLFAGYQPFLGEIDTLEQGKLVALESGMVTSHALVKLQQRGDFIVRPGDDVYAGQVVGSNIRADELVINICQAKQLTNFREKPSGTSDMLVAPRDLSLDEAIQYLDKGDLLEVTPTALRVRKKELRHEVRQREAKRARLAQGE